VSVLALVAAMALSLAAAAFCAGAETAFLSVSRLRVLHLAREGGRKAKVVQRALSDMGRTTVTLLIGNNVASVAYSAASAALVAECCRGSFARGAWGFASAFLVLYASEFMPKLLCAARPLRRSLSLAWPYAAMEAVLRPLASAAIAFTNLFISGSSSAKYRLTSADLMRILEDRKDGVCLSDLESALISRIMVLRVKGRPITAEAILSALRDYE